MPYTQIDGPAIQDIETKRILVKEITDALEKAYKLPRETYVVIVREDHPENVGVGGELIIDREKK